MLVAGTEKAERGTRTSTRRIGKRLLDYDLAKLYGGGNRRPPANVPWPDEAKEPPAQFLPITNRVAGPDVSPTGNPPEATSVRPLSPARRLRLADPGIAAFRAFPGVNNLGTQGR